MFGSAHPRIPRLRSQTHQGPARLRLLDVLALRARDGLALGADVDRLAELADSVAERFGQLGQALGAEHDERDDADEQDVNGIVDAHITQASARVSSSPPRREPAKAAITSGAPPTLSLVEQAASVQPGRPYPPRASPESFWPAQLTVLATIALQLALPQRLTVGPIWVIPAVETALLVGLSLITPRKLVHEHARRRRIALGITALVSAANVFSLGALTHYLLHNNVNNGRELIGAGVLIWLTNFLIFSLWYWEMDRGGPGLRAAGHDGAPDFLFPQMSDDRIEPSDWRPHFIDYLYVSLTNATAFSPTDTMPLTPVAKSVMGLQSVVSLVTVGLIVSRAVNIL